jgi:hypothetical protein
MTINAKDDLLSGEKLREGELEDHHIYPRSLRKTHDFDIKKLDAITNRILVSRKSNSELSDTLPDKYFSELQQRTISMGIEGQVNNRLKQCLIPGDITHIHFAKNFTLDNFDVFLNARGEMILEKVREIIGNALKNEESIDDED